ncbi:uncharacterized protein E0L32_012316 [Thyridium curvatum]|uniref:Zn(2)-C6 fungal-type domain-containing protein n=1 Tax=Thyridium curvatum TaxID=1093900 RepID=A0A507BE51_9PEZI|nr:uncharacterized protein E0L32_012316 [Thyridium curvatum]TPX17024.1 hypothetical protein E0L32_012316 [Thyridium curvatum]
MSSYVHSRATGRSGPKVKTGCMTCRRRKVRCDEKKPVCANCTRLRIPCAYQVRDPIKQTRKSHQQSSEAVPCGQNDSRLSREPHRDGGQPQATKQHCQQLPPLEAHLDSMPARHNTTSPASVPGTDQHSQTANAAPASSHDPLITGSVSGDPVGDMPAPGILGLTSPFQDVFFSSINLADFDLGPDAGSDLAFDGVSPFFFPSESYRGAEPAGQSVSQGKKELERQLLEHFIHSANPISVILPSHTEWASACRALLIMARDSPCLSAAVYSLSAMHMYSTKQNDLLDVSMDYYKTSSSELEALFQLVRPGDPKTDLSLKSAFATLFLLSHVELTAQSTPHAEQWPLRHVRSAQTRVREHSERIKTWAGISRRLLTWMSLLQTKIEYNAGNPSQSQQSALESCNTDSTSLRMATGDPFTNRHKTQSPEPNDSRIEVNETTDDPRTPAELACDTINQPALDFHLRTQSFTPRIIVLDHYHRQRGTLEAEYEVLQIGHRISSDLHALWASRPPTFAFLDAGSTGLIDVFQPSVAYSIVRDLRVYAAGFWAHLIYLHRVAFVNYPATEDVHRAVSEIMKLASDLDRDRKQFKYMVQVQQQHSPAQAPSLHGPSSDAGTAAVADMDSLPHTLMWPLFMAGLECSISDRYLVLQMMREIQGLPTSDKVLLLLQEVLRKQDEKGHRVDHRELRRELFDSELSVLY